MALPSPLCTVRILFRRDFKQEGALYVGHVIDIVGRDAIPSYEILTARTSASAANLYTFADHTRRFHLYLASYSCPALHLWVVVYYSAVPLQKQAVLPHSALRGALPRV